VTGVKCNAGFDQPGSLRKHEDRMHGAPRFFCEECTIPSSEGLPTPMGFTTKAQMDKHLRDKHINCPFCDQTFGSKAELHSHNENTHSEGSPKLPLAARKTFQCPYAGCDKSFTKNNNLSFHIRSIHEGRRFVCGQHDLQNSAATEGWNGEGGCGKECVSKANLEDHVRTQHMGLPSIINAGRVTYTRKARKARKEPSTVGLLTGKAYEEEQGRDILCTVDECPYRFTRPYDLKVHLRAKHHIDIPDFDSDTDAEDPTYMEEMYSTAEDTFDRRESELREQAHFTDIENSNFWIGGTDSKLADRRDGEGEMWGMEEQEMRNLIDEASMPRHDGLEGLLDPALMALSAE
jgi:general transcription factor IIIA